MTSCFFCCESKLFLHLEQKTEANFEQSPRARSESSFHYKSEDRLTTCASHHRSNAVMETIEEQQSSFEL